MALPFRTQPDSAFVLLLAPIVADLCLCHSFKHAGSLLTAHNPARFPTRLALAVPSYTPPVYTLEETAPSTKRSATLPIALVPNPKISRAKV